MKNLIQCALGENWHKLPPALQSHYQPGMTTETGHMDIEYPQFMQAYLSVLRVFGALINRSGSHVPTVVEKRIVGDRQYWRRTITYPDGKVVNFNSFWISAGGNQIIEFVNPVLGLQMSVNVENDKLHYRGVRFVAKLGSLLLPIPEWLVLGHTSIVETALDETHFAMDFRLTHPLLGRVFRYSGVFESASARSVNLDVTHRLSS
jgi:hypothetical protein